MPYQPETAFQEMARGDASAVEFLRAIYIGSQILDDLIDKDKPVTAEMAVWSQTHLICTVATNSFFQAHKATLIPVICTSALAFIASEERKNHPDVLERLTAQVLKSEYLNVFLAVSFCVGGWQHAAEMSRKYREYSFDNEPVQAPEIKLDKPTEIG